MKQISLIGFLVMLTVSLPLFSQADDTCIFYPSTDEVPPSIVLYIDNSGEMEEARWHDDFDSTVDWTPKGAVNEAIDDPKDGDAFLNQHGYGIYTQGRGVYLAPFKVSSENVMEMDTSKMIEGKENEDNGTFSWTFNGKTITLPVESKTNALEEFGATNADLVTAMRYSTNYLNWLFFSGEYRGDGADLKSENRFYSAKKALARVMLETENKAMFSLWYHTNDDGATQNKPLEFALTEDESGNFTIRPSYLLSLNGMQTYDYSPLAEGLAEVAGYYDSAASHGENYDCAQNFIIMISSGVSSKDIGGNNVAFSLTAADYEPDNLEDYDGDNTTISEGWIIENMSSNGLDDDGDGVTDESDEQVSYQIPIGYEGSTYLDDIAYYIYNNDVGYPDGFQNIITYTIGFMGDHVSNLFLINTSNNGNGFTNLYNTNDPDYGKYHWEVSDPDDLVDALSEAIDSILQRTTVFAAPVVPVTRTTSGDRIYMSFFTPRPGNFWEGNVVKFALNEDNKIIDKNGDFATYDNGALKEDAVPFWATIDWAADPLSSTAPRENGIFYSQRPIYTYLGSNVEITASVNAFNETNITAELLGNPVHSAEEIINYIRGADVFDEDEDTITDENRNVITGDVLHSEPAVYEFIHSEGTLKLENVTGTTLFEDGELLIGDGGGRAYANGGGDGSSIKYQQLLSPFTPGEIVTGASSNVSGTITSDGLSDRTMIFFGANDGMLHAVKDEDGTASWSFIPPNQLARLKEIVEGRTHGYFVDGSPKLYLVDDDGDGFIDTDGDDDNDGNVDSDPDQVVLVCGERKGSSSFFALDVTDPDKPKYLWRISPTNDTTFAWPNILGDLGESWSEPTFGLVKTGETEIYDELARAYITTDTIKPALIIGGGFSSDNSTGTSVYILDLLEGTEIKRFTPANTASAAAYSFPSAVVALDTNNNGILDKLYVGDLGGNMYRFGRFTESDGKTLLEFPDVNEDISTWQSHLLFSVNDATNFTSSTFYYPPSITLERGYDLVFMGTGDRENPCDPSTTDGAFVLKDTNDSGSYTVSNLLDITDPEATDYSLPNLDEGSRGWYYRLATGEKVLSRGTVFNQVYYFTTFTPSTDPCLPGGLARLYALNYKTGEAIIDFSADGTLDTNLDIGGGIPSRPVLVINDDPGDTKLLISVGSTNPDDDSESQGAGIISTDPEFENNFFYLWWRDWIE